MNSWPQFGSPLDLRAGFRVVLDVAAIDKPREAVIDDLAVVPGDNRHANAERGISASD